MFGMSILLRLALAACIGLTVAGLLAPAFPWLDAANHPRPFIFAGAVCLMLLARHAAMSMAWRIAVAVAAVNAVLFASPLLWSAQSTRGQAQAEASGGRHITIVSFNMAWAERPVDNVAHYVLARAPDIVMLQEVTRKHAAALHRLLDASYPYSHECTHVQGCSQIIFSRHKWVEAQHIYRASGDAEMIWARFDDARLGKLRVHSLHAAWPFTPHTQVRHVDRLIARAQSITEPAIFAGDFNLTPWSYQLQRLQFQTGLRRHATFLRSWPTDGQLRLPIPLLLIDHILTTRDIRTLSIATGPDLGSDHLPIIATLALP